MSPEDSGVQLNDNYQNNIIITDLSKELMEEEDVEAVRRENGLTEVKINIEGKAVSYTHLDVYKRQILLASVCK